MIESAFCGSGNIDNQLRKERFMRWSLSVESLKISHIPSLGFSIMGSCYLEITEMVLSIAQNWMTLRSIWCSNYWKHSFQLWQDFSRHCFNQKRIIQLWITKTVFRSFIVVEIHWIVASRASSGMVKFMILYMTLFTNKLQIQFDIYLEEHALLLTSECQSWNHSGLDGCQPSRLFARK